MYPPNFYTDDEWNDLVPDERWQSSSYTYSVEELAALIEEQEKAQEQIGYPTCQEDYEELNRLNRLKETYIDMIIEAENNEKHPNKEQG